MSSPNNRFLRLLSHIHNNTTLLSLSHHNTHSSSSSSSSSLLINTMASPDSEILHEFPHLFRIYKDGRVQRFLGTETTPPGTDPKTNVQSKDVTINATTGAAARLYLPPAADKGSKLPLLIYIHGGAFCVCTPFNPAYHNHLNTVSAAANVVVASVHYRLAPEAPMPACYDDSWEVVKWAASHASAGGPEPWLNDHADIGAVFFAGDSAGGNIAHNMVMRRSEEGLEGLRVEGMVLLHPYFGNEQKDELVAYLYPTYEGPTNVMIHSPMDPKISNLGCPRVLIFVSEKDFLRDRGCAYHDALTKSGWKGKGDIVEFAGEDHVFHLFAPTKDNSFSLVSQFIAFLKEGRA